VKANATWDVAIVGAGPGGAMCALSCARAGLRPLLIEKNPAGAPRRPLIIEIEKGVLERCGVRGPTAAEIAYAPRVNRIHGPSGKPAFEIREHRADAIRLEQIVTRLLGPAREAGAAMRFGATAAAPLFDGDRVAGLVVSDRRGQPSEVRARVVVDASGFDAALVRQMPARLGFDFVDRPEDRVWAEARLYEIDGPAARAAAEAGRIAPEDMHTQVGVQGGYSVRAYMVSLKKRFAYILSGVKENQGPPLAAEVADALARELGFLKRIVHHGRGVIRIRRAGLRLVSHGFAVLGEAGGMVIPAHASGAASALLAGHSLGVRLGRIFARGSEPTTAALWPSAGDWQRGRGAVLATYDANRRVLESFDALREIDPLFVSGVVRAEDLLNTTIAAPLTFAPASLPARLAGALRCPAAAAKFAAGAPKIFLVGRHWSNYPQTWDEAAYAKWAAKAMRMLP